MSTLIGKTAVAFVATAMLTGCGGGGTSESLPAEGDVAAVVEGGAADAAAVAETAVSEASDAVTESAEAVANVAEDAAGGSWNALQDNWQDSIGSVKDRWAELTEEDLLAVDGDRDQLVSLVQDRYGLEREAAELEVDDWASTL